jgi:hypothetical protein
MYHILKFYILPLECSFCISTDSHKNSDHNPNGLNELVSVAETYCISSEVRTEFLYIVTGISN